MARTLLTSSIALTVDPNGSYPTLTAAYEYVRDNIDFGPYGVLIEDPRSVSTEPFTAYGKCVGQVHVSSLIIRGINSSIRRPTTGRCIGAEDDASFQFEGFTLDQSQNDGNGDASTVTVGNGSHIWQGPGVTFGDAALGSNYDIQAAFHSEYGINNDFTVHKSSVSTNGSFHPTSNQLGVASSGGIKPFMRITGIGNDNCYVQSVAGAWVTIGGGLPGFTSGYSPVTFCAGSGALIQGDPFSFVHSNAITCTIYNRPYWINGLLSGDFQATYMQGVQFKRPDGTVIPQSDFALRFRDPHNNAVIDVG